VPTNTALINYYAQRAQEYERLYEKPERQADLAVLKKLCGQLLAGRRVLEIACGTGYWTQAVSQTAKSIFATDINAEMLLIARAKAYGCAICFQQADAFDLGSLGQSDFTAGLAMAWWSHLRKSEVKAFLDGFHRQFRPGSILVFMDNRFVAGSSTPISRTDDEGNTYQLRRLENGTSHEVLKNFPSQIEVKNVLAGAAADFRWTDLPHYWFLTYTLR
jgi:demethylmenaquinone methyltransferase/2-methoxy-6-polyprenyl-1,4-benzoquinol methylase